MTPEHPVLQTLADHRAGVLPEAENATVAAHVATCGECAAACGAIAEVSALLADTSTAPLDMPAEVVARLDSALGKASDERTGKVVTLNRSSTAETARARRRTWPVMAAAAAAAVIVGGAALANSDIFGESSSDAASTAPAADAAGVAGEAEAAQGGAAGGEAGQSKGPTQDNMLSAPNRSESLSPSDIPAYAAGLARSATEATPVRKSCAPITVAEGDVVTGVRWRGDPATLVVDAENRTATVLDCATASRVLFHAGY